MDEGQHMVLMFCQENCEFPNNHGMVIGNAGQNNLPLEQSIAGNAAIHNDKKQLALS
jgi:hypothetical protein